MQFTPLGVAGPGGVGSGEGKGREHALPAYSPRRLSDWMRILFCATLVLDFALSPLRGFFFFF